MNNDFGYTIIEMLVALTLLLLLLFFSTNIFYTISFERETTIRRNAISAANTQMAQTVITNNFSDFEERLDFNLILKQKIEKVNNLYLIKIYIFKKNTGQEVYSLFFYENYR